MSQIQPSATGRNMLRHTKTTSFRFFDAASGKRWTLLGTADTIVLVAGPVADL